MNSYGVELNKSTKDQLEKMSKSTNNKCFTCGESGHFSKDCKKDDKSCNYSEENVIWCCEYCDKEFEDESKCEYHEQYCKKKNKQNFCFKCRKYGHFANNWWFNKSSKKCNICGKYGHYEVNCYQF